MQTHLWQLQVLQFMDVFKQDVATKPRLPTKASADLGAKLIREEVKETLDALEAGDLPEVIDGVGDAIYVLLGLANRCGVSMAPVFAAIHRANMAKVGGPVVDGKQLKPPGWTPPNIEAELRAQGWDGK